MKYVFLFLILGLSVSSCDDTKKYQGKWTQNIYKTSDLEQPFTILIENDSIKFNYVYFDHKHSFPLTINGSRISFADISLRTKIIEDTLSFNNSNFYIKDDSDSIKTWNSPNYKLSIALPGNSIKTGKKLPDNINTQIRIGKRHDNKEFSLQLNDKYSPITDLRRFVRIQHNYHKIFPSNIIFCDKNTPMSFLENVFFELQKENHLKIVFVNDIELHSNDSLGLYYGYKTLSKKLPPLIEKDSYVSSIYQYSLPPPYSLGIDSEIFYIGLLKNQICYRGTATSKERIKEELEKAIKNGDVVISLFDLESDYKSFLDLNAFVDSAYSEIRDEKALSKFGKKLDQLNREELNKIKTETPLKHIWNYSIPHYNSILKADKSFFGPNAEPMYTIVPKI